MATKTPAKQKVITIQRWQIGLNVLIQTLIIAVIVVLVNYISFRHFKRWDFSRDQQYALSSQTKNVLGSLQKPVHAVIFFSSAAELMPDLNNLLREYEYASNKKFQVEAVDPYRNLTRAQELATKYKIQANDNIVILDYDGRNKFVNATDMAQMEAPDQMQMMTGAAPKMKAFTGEAAITAALLELTAGKANKVYLVTGHGEPNLTGPEYRSLSELMKRQNIQTAPLNLLDTGRVPEDARSLMLYGPKYDLSELEVKYLSEFWDKKGSFFICLNPAAKTPRLAAWLSEQGVKPQDDRVLGTANFMRVNEETGLPEFSKGIVTQAPFTIPENGSPVVKDLSGVTKQLLGFTESLQIDQAKVQIARLKINPVMQSVEGFWGEVEPFGDLTKAYFDAKKGDIQGPLTLAVTVEKGAVEQAKVEGSRMLVVGNADLLNDKEYRMSEGVSGDFAINAMNWVLAHEEAIGIPPKEKKTVTISLDSKQLRNIALIVMGAIPGLVAVLGVLNWTLRRS